MLTITVTVGEGTKYEIPGKLITAVTGLLSAVCVGASIAPVLPDDAKDANVHDEEWDR